MGVPETPKPARGPQEPANTRGSMMSCCVSHMLRRISYDSSCGLVSTSPLGPIFIEVPTQGLMVKGTNRDGCGSKPMGSHIGAGAPPILEPILVVGLGCSLGARFGF